MFSIVIPLYNKEDYIYRAVESVLNQEYKIFELIIVDDGSTDNSIDKIKTILDSRVKVVKQSNQGVSAARNKGIVESKHEWIAFLDADDAWDKQHLKELSVIIEKFPDSGMVSTRIMEVKDSKKSSIAKDNNVSNIRSIDYFYEASNITNIVHSSSVAINKKVFKDIGGFSNKKIGEDVEYWVKIALSYPIAISDKITAYYFRDTDGCMQNYIKSIKKRNQVKKYSLHDISPAVSLLIQEAQSNPAILKRSSIRLYINTMILNMMKTSVVDRNIYKADNLSELALFQFNRKYVYIIVYRFTPNLLLEKFFNFYMSHR